MKFQTLKQKLSFYIIILFILSGCNGCEQKRATPVIDSKVVTKHINATGITSVTAQCPEGKQMVGGGFTVNPDARVFIIGTYPVSKDTWEVDLVNMSQPDADPATLSVSVYYYTGEKDLGMQIKKEDVPFVAPPPFGFATVYRSTSIEKPVPSDVVTSGGFKLANSDIIENAVLGSFPTLKPPMVGQLDNVLGWTNNMYVLAGKSSTITNYLMYSMGAVQVGSNNPVFDQGPAIHKNSSALAISPSGTFQFEGNTDYFCTGGGYNLQVNPNAPIHYPVQVWQNNATTQSGLFFGWQFKGLYFSAADEWDIYDLQLKLH
jgi:hypothetical protein